MDNFQQNQAPLPNSSVPNPQKPNTIISTILLILGALLFVFSIVRTAIATRPGNLDYAGLFIIIGVLCYKSLQASKNGAKQYSVVKRTFQIVGLALLVAIPIFVALQHNEFMSPASDPLTFIALPLVLIGAYVVALVRKPCTTN